MQRAAAGRSHRATMERSRTGVCVARGTGVRAACVSGLRRRFCPSGAARSALSRGELPRSPTKEYAHPAIADGRPSAPLANRHAGRI